MNIIYWKLVFRTWKSLIGVCILLVQCLFFSGSGDGGAGGGGGLGVGVYHSFKKKCPMCINIHLRDNTGGHPPFIKLKTRHLHTDLGSN